MSASSPVLNIKDSRMFKLVSSLAFLAVVMGQGPLPYQVSLDPSYSFGWGVSNNTIEIQLDVSTKGWVSFGLVSDDGKMLDIWWGGYDEDYGVNYGQDGFAEYSNLTPGPRYPDTLQNLNLISINQSPFNTTTRVRFSRAFTTPDFKQDVDIPYNTRQIILWSFADADAPSNPAVKSGLAQLILRPAL